MRKRDIAVGAIIGSIVGLLFWGISKNLALQLPYLWTAVFVFPALSASGVFAAGVLGRKIPVLYQAAKFLLVGALNTFVDLGILNLLIFTSGVATGFLFTLFKAVSFAGAVLNSYGWNKYWTFGKRETQSVRKEFFQFVVISVGGFLLNVGTASVVVNLVEPQFDLSPELWANVGALTATLVAMTWNFLGYKLIVFRR